MPALLTKVRPVVCLSRSITLALSPRPSRTSPLALYNAEKPMYGLLLARSSIVFCSSAGNARQRSPAIAWRNGRLEQIRVRDQTMGVLSQALHRACSKRRTCSKRPCVRRRSCVPGLRRAARSVAAPRRASSYVCLVSAPQSERASGEVRVRARMIAARAITLYTGRR